MFEQFGGILDHVVVFYVSKPLHQAREYSNMHIFGVCVKLDDYIDCCVKGVTLGGMVLYKGCHT